ncbi:hypothetical protein GCM10009104_21110 [Marinobacterium maritimum]|uniref:Response regulatory domain-containing protein n=1 Tax=Marinobacterium maritimum TaxID=500162 RepID=A0ABN1I6X6_9GAMM
MEHISELAVLVVDDQPIINEFYRKILEQLGCKWIYSALSGEEAAKLLASRGDINLVLTDIDMHPGNGLELLQAIRCGDIPNTSRDLCVMVVTDYNYRHNVMKAVGLDCQGFLSKPLNAGLLADKIHAALHRTVNLAPAETYRGIETDIRLNRAIASPDSLPPLESRSPSVSSPAESSATMIQDRAPPLENEGSTHPSVAPPGPSDAEAALETALNELLPAGIKDGFLIHKQGAIREILNLLDHIGKALNFASEAELVEMIDQLEQMSTDLFQQEYLHQREHSYQPLSAHQAEHGLILQRTQMLSGKLGRHPERAIKAHQQLREAWYRHISGKDRMYVNFLQNQGSRA